MLNVTGKYVTVFKPCLKTEKSFTATLSTSKKNVINGEVVFKNMSWYARFVGVAFEKAKNLKDFDKIDIIKGCISNDYDKNRTSQPLMLEVTVFDFVFSDVKNRSVDEEEI